MPRRRGRGASEANVSFAKCRLVHGTKQAGILVDLKLCTHAQQP